MKQGKALVANTSGAYIAPRSRTYNTYVSKENRERRVPTHRDKCFLGGEVDSRLDIFHERLSLPNKRVIYLGRDMGGGGCVEGRVKSAINFFTYVNADEKVRTAPPGLATIQGRVVLFFMYSVQ